MQVVTLDFWEDVYTKILEAAGMPYIVFFIATVFFGAFFVINLVLAVVAMSYASSLDEDDIRAGGSGARFRSP
jgi:hypothetical protein